MVDLTENSYRCTVPEIFPQWSQNYERENTNEQHWGNTVLRFQNCKTQFNLLAVKLTLFIHSHVHIIGHYYPFG